MDNDLHYTIVVYMPYTILHQPVMTNFYLCQIDISNVELIIRFQPSPASIICPLLFLVNFCNKQLTQFPPKLYFFLL